MRAMIVCVDLRLMHRLDCEFMFFGDLVCVCVCVNCRTHDHRNACMTTLRFRVRRIHTSQRSLRLYDMFEQIRVGSIYDEHAVLTHTKSLRKDHS